MQQYSTSYQLKGSTFRYVNKSNKSKSTSTAHTTTIIRIKFQFSTSLFINQLLKIN